MKKSQKLIKIIYVLVILWNIMIMVSGYVSADISIPNMNGVYSSGDTVISSIGGKIIWVLEKVFYAAALIILMFTGISYMNAAPEAKANIKKKLIYMSVGATMLFAAGGIVRILYNLAQKNIVLQ